MLGTLVLPGEGVRQTVMWSGVEPLVVEQFIAVISHYGQVSYLTSRYLDTANLGHEATR